MQYHRGAAARRVIDRQRRMDRLGETARYGQTKADTIDGAVITGPLERLEHTGAVTGRNAPAVVDDAQVDAVGYLTGDDPHGPTTR
jgi:hypothetical protein